LNFNPDSADEPEGSMYSNLLLLFASVVGGWSILRLMGAERERLIQSIPPEPPSQPAPPAEPAVLATTTAKAAPPAKAVPLPPPATAKKK
jgi:hypothetical protein